MGFLIRGWVLFWSPCNMLSCETWRSRNPVSGIRLLNKWVIYKGVQGSGGFRLWRSKPDWPRFRSWNQFTKCQATQIQDLEHFRTFTNSSSPCWFMKPDVCCQCPSGERYAQRFWKVTPHTWWSSLLAHPEPCSFIPAAMRFRTRQFMLIFFGQPWNHAEQGWSVLDYGETYLAGGLLSRAHSWFQAVV